MNKKQKDLMANITPEMMEMIQLLAEQMAQTKIEESSREKEQKNKKVTKTDEPVTKKYLRDKYKDSTITLMNVTNGSVTYKSPKGGFPYVWSGYGDTDELSIDDLLVMPQKYLTSPWLMIIDSDGDIVKGLGLERYYKYINILDDIDDIENFDIEQLEEAIKVFTPSKSREFVNKVASRIQDKITSGELDSNRKILYLEQILNKDFIRPNRL